MERSGAKFLVWHVPALVPPLSWRCDGLVPTDRVVPELEEWSGYVGKLLNSPIDYDVFISVFTGSDHFQHHNWGADGFLDFYDNVARHLLKHIGEHDDVLVVSDHGFTDIDTSLAHMWTWEPSKRVNRDTGHHAPWGICATNLRWRPFKVSEVHEAIVRHLASRGIVLK